MRSALLIAVVLLSVTSAYAGPRAPVRPTAEELEKAFWKKDPVELERLGSRIGAVRLVALAERGTPAARRAALAALELTSGSMELLPRLVAIAAAGDTEPALATEAIECVRRICERAAHGELELDELPRDLPRAAADALVALAEREDRALPLREKAVAALAALAAFEPTAGKKLATLAAVKEAHVRRAVADALPASSPLLPKILGEDGTVEVALQAAASLCRELPAVGTEKKGDKALQRVAELPAPTRARLRQLVRDSSLPEPDRVDVVPCFRPGAQPPAEKAADADLLRELGRGPEGPLRKKARAYGGR